MALSSESEILNPYRQEDAARLYILPLGGARRYNGGLPRGKFGCDFLFYVRICSKLLDRDLNRRTLAAQGNWAYSERRANNARNDLARPKNAPEGTVDRSITFQGKSRRVSTCDDAG